MPTLWSYSLKAAAALLSAFATPTAQAQVTAKTAQSLSKDDHSTCPSRTLNYITQTLPQQCLTSSWSSRQPHQHDATKDLAQDTPISQVLQGQTSDTRFTVAVTSTLQAYDKAKDAENSSEPTATSILSSSALSALEPNKTPEAINDADQHLDNDSPLDNANFLSFEEWKKQNLAKAGQSAESLSGKTSGGEPRRRPGPINNALDSLGEDTEIEIDFGGFVNTGASPPGGYKPGPSMDDGNISDRDKGTQNVAKDDEHSSVRKRGKDAGKTCKERSNYASFDCAATMLKTNPESKGSNLVLVENKDSYMLNVCSAKNKFFIVELCDDILIDTVVLANFEFFSSMFRTFRVSVSDRYPAKPDKWRDLGTFEAKNSREVQAFLIENPLIWARYLRVELLTHFGNEYYCPISLLRVHGTTMMEEFNHELKRTGTEEDPDGENGEGEEAIDNGLSPEVISADVLKDGVQGSSTQVMETGTQSLSPPVTTPVPNPGDIPLDETMTTTTLHPGDVSTADLSSHNSSINKPIESLLLAMNQTNSWCARGGGPPTIVRETPDSSPNSTSIVSTQATSTKDLSVTQSPRSTNHTAHASTSITNDVPTHTPLERTGKARSNHSEESVRPYNQTSTTAVKTHSSSTQPHNASPTTQESFFKSVHKRLQLLESNSTLSLQYIEEQSRILRDAFSKVEKRQLGKSTTFLETLNTTVLTELRDFRNQYDQIWQSTVLELSSQREQSQHEVLVLSTRLSLLADEIIFQKRMAILQFLLILLCLGLVIFSRGGSSSPHLELPPLVQNAITKSSGSLSRYTPQFESPPTSPASTRPSSRYDLFRGFTHRRGPSDESQVDETQDGVRTPNIEYSPPTPTSPVAVGDHRGDEDHSSDGSPLRAEPGSVRQTKSTPATPSGHLEEPGEFVGSTPLVSRADDLDC